MAREISISTSGIQSTSGERDMDDHLVVESHHQHDLTEFQAGSSNNDPRVEKSEENVIEINPLEIQEVTINEEGNFVVLTPLVSNQDSRTGYSSNILDQSVREAFYSDNYDDEEEQRDYERSLRDELADPTYDPRTDDYYPRHPQIPASEMMQQEEERRCEASFAPQNLNQDSQGSSSGSERKVDPFDPTCRIPIPGTFGDFTSYPNSRNFVRRRNERERARVRNVNDGFERLRSHLPVYTEPKDRRLSKVETLREAIKYIRDLQAILANDDESRS